MEQRNAMKAHRHAAMNVNAELSVPSAQVQVVNYEFGEPPQSVLRMEDTIRVEMSLSARHRSARACFADRWSSQRFEHIGEMFVLPPTIDMTARSDNDATSALVALLHARGAVAADEIHRLFASRGLTTLRFERTTPAGGWRNADGAGVGHIQMTAWDTVRLLWLLDPAAPPAPWLPRGTPPLLGASRAHVLACLRGQRLHHVLSSHTLRRAPGWVDGIPAEVAFAHKTGSTENYASDAGIAQGLAPRRRHYLVALISNLGSRHAPPGTDCVGPWGLPALGAALDAHMTELLERPQDPR